MGRKKTEKDAGATQFVVCSTDLLIYCSLTQRYELIEGFSEIFFACCAEPVSYYYVVAGDQVGDGLASDSVEVPDRVVEAPFGVGEQFVSHFLRRVEPGLPCHCDEPHVVHVVGLNSIYDGQLPSAHASPLGPEDQVDGLLLCRESEVSPISESKREVGSGRSFDGWGRRFGRLGPRW